MHISKFDLYRSEWLELVFDDRNKEYGAYDLRKHYAGNLVKAMGITFFSITLLFVAYGFLFKHKPVEIIKEVPITLDPRIIIAPPKVDIPRPAHTLPPPPHRQTIAYTTFVPRDILTTNPPTIVEISKSTIGPETVKGLPINGSPPPQPLGPGDISGPKVNTDDPVSTFGLDAMPEPYGGTNAWSKFLQKNIRYPNQAVDAGVQGKVWITFIIERDGHLSNITVEKGVGSGLDDEALRVLKLAPAWKPGKQNGQAVRVKYTIPINFILPDNG